MVAPMGFVRRVHVVVEVDAARARGKRRGARTFDDHLLILDEAQHRQRHVPFVDLDDLVHPPPRDRKLRHPPSTQARTRHKKAGDMQHRQAAGSTAGAENAAEHRRLLRGITRTIDSCR